MVNGLSNTHLLCSFTDMEVLYWKHAKERLAAQRQLQKRMVILLF